MLLSGHTSASGAVETRWEQCTVRPAPALAVHVLCQPPFSPSCELCANIFPGRLVVENDYIPNIPVSGVGILPILYIVFYWSV